MKRRGLITATALALAAVVIIPLGLGSPFAGPDGQDAAAAKAAVEATIHADGSPIAGEAQDGADTAESTDTAAGEPAFGGLEYDPGVVLVTLAENIAPAEAIAQIAAETDLDGWAVADGTATDEAASAPEEPTTVELALPEGVSVEAAIEAIGATDAIAAAQPNFIYHLQDDPADAGESARATLMAQNLIVQDLVTQAASVNDPFANSQWALKSMYVYGNSDYNAWDLQTTDGDVTVAVIDNGFQADHEDLKNNVVNKFNAVTGAVGDAADLAPGGDKSLNHGTHVAGIVAAEANNGKGSAGVSYNAGLMLIRASDDNGNFTSKDLATAVKYATRMKSVLNVRVINMSVGGESTLAGNWADDVLIQAIDMATDQGVAVVCSAGNAEGDSKVPYIDYPADYKNVISVINLRQYGTDPHNVRRSTTSNYNDPSTTTEASMNTGKNISAPGNAIYSSALNNKYIQDSGTSMAAPQVAGVLALVFAANPNLTVAQATSLLYSTATDVEYADGSEVAGEGWDPYTGYGEVNAYAAVRSSDAAFLSGNTTLQAGKTLTLAAPGGSWPWSAWTWTTSNSSVATVAGNSSYSSYGTVSGHAPGTARITARRLYGSFFAQTLYQDIYVYDPTILSATGGFSIADKKASLAYGGTAQLKVADGQPAGSWNWSTSNAKVVSVNAATGAITAKGVGTATVTAMLNGASISDSITVTVTKADLSNAHITLNPASYAYDGKAKQPTPTVTWNGTTLAAGTDYTVSYANNTQVGTAKATIAGTGNFSGTASKSFVITAKPTASDTASSGSGSTNNTNGASSNGASSNAGTGSNASAASATGGSSSAGGSSATTATTGSTGNRNTSSSSASSSSSTGSAAQAGSAQTTAKSGTQWKRLWGQTALDTMQSIVREGAWPTGGTVVIATAADYYDGLTANGVAGLAGAPIVMTDGSSFSPQAKSVITMLKPATIIICGGAEAISADVMNEAKSAAGTSPHLYRLWGQTADDTAVEIYKQGVKAAGGTWAKTAFICTDNGYWDALSAAPISYAKHMPIFLTRGEGAGLSDDALRAMRDGGIDNVYIVGGTEAVKPAVADQLSKAGISVTGRLAGDDAVGTSVEVARFGMKQGLTANYLGIATTDGYWDALAGAALCGYRGAGIVLVSGPSSATISKVVKPNVYDIAQGYVFGGTEAISATTYAALPTR